MAETIKLARYRLLPYVVNFENKRYVWNGAVGNRIDIKEVPQELFDNLSMNGCTISSGELVVVDEDKKDLVNDFVLDSEQLKNNIHKREEIVKILEMPIAKMKKELDKITNEEEKRFVLYVAKEIKLDSSSKRRVVLDFLGIENVAADDVFEE